MQNNFNLPNENDSITHALICNGEVNVILINAKNTVAQASKIHGTSPVCTAALGRTLIATAMLGARIKNENCSVTTTIFGAGPAGKITAVSNGKTVKGDISFPQADLPIKANGKLDVSGIVGKNGYITVVKDIGLKTPYIGQTKIVSGEIAEDFALYLSVSEQQPSIVSLGVLTSGDICLSAGGILVAPMPGCSDKNLDELDRRVMLMSDISKELLYDSPEVLINKWFEGLNPEILSVEPFEYKCDCSREKMERVLIALGKKELNDILNDDQEGVEIVCHFCHKKHNFSDSDIEHLIENI